MCVLPDSLGCSLTEPLLDPVMANVFGLIELVVVFSPLACWKVVLASSGIGIGGWAGLGCGWTLAVVSLLATGYVKYILASACLTAYIFLYVPSSEWDTVSVLESK